MSRDREHKQQKAFIEWSKLNMRYYPSLRLLFSVPNGGARHVAVARKLKAEGVRAGVPDLWLPVARGGFNGLVIEFKPFHKKGLTTKTYATTEQKWWLGQLADEGYFAVLVYGSSKAIDITTFYLQLPKI